jgi:hypothetical protein
LPSALALSILGALTPWNKVVFMPVRISRRHLLAGLTVSLAALPLLGSRVALAAPERMPQSVEVWKSPTCGCCTAWVDHLKAAGFAVTVHDVDDVEAVKTAHGVPRALRSCHTALVGGYVVEGHVPAADLRRLLAERPQAGGLAVAGMPQDAPGMDMHTGEPYQVVLFGAPGGGTTVYASH